MIIGIDLGTTNSLAAAWRDGGPVLIPNSLGETLTPSCVSIDDDGSVLVGLSARERLQTHPARSAALFKRHMGSDKRLTLAGRDYRPEELSSLVLRALKADAESFLQEEITEAIITVPAYFSDLQRKATRTAGELAGLRVERLINEPTAAALAHGIHERSESQFLVFDLGGGTFDVSILELFEGVMEVRATAGDNFLGGEDFNAGLIAWFIEQSELPPAARQDPRLIQQLAAQVELAKRRLSTETNATIGIRWKDLDYRLDLDEAKLRSLSEPLLERLRTPLERALRDADIRAADIDQVILAGGATRSPMIRNLVTRMFGRFPSATQNPDEIVAAGAAVMAGLKMRDIALREVVMTDVCPYTMGVETSRQLSNGTHVAGQFSPIIERNTVVPVSRVETYFPTNDGQADVNLQIYQGESRLVHDNIHLGTLNVPLPSKKREEGGLDVRFTYDVNGLLEIEATTHLDQAQHRMVIDSRHSSMTDADIQRRLAELAELKIHPREKAENRALLASAERLYQMTRGDSRDLIANEIALFEEALRTQDERTLKHARSRLRALVRHMDSGSVFDPSFDE